MRFQSTSSRTGHFAAHVSGALVIFEFHTQAVAADWREVSHVLQATAQKSGKVSCIAISPVHIAPMSPETREAMREQQRQTQALIFASAVVIPVGTGSSLAIRTVLSGVTALGLTSVPTRTLTSVPDALCWVQGLTGQAPDVKAVTVEELPTRAQLRAA
jgi:hypothetical protein